MSSEEQSPDETQQYLDQQYHIPSQRGGNMSGARSISTPYISHPPMSYRPQSQSDIYIDPALNATQQRPVRSSHSTSNTHPSSHASSTVQRETATPTLQPNARRSYTNQQPMASTYTPYQAARLGPWSDPAHLQESLFMPEFDAVPSASATFGQPDNVLRSRGLGVEPSAHSSNEQFRFGYYANVPGIAHASHYGSTFQHFDHTTSSATQQTSTYIDEDGNESNVDGNSDCIEVGSDQDSEDMRSPPSISSRTPTVGIAGKQTCVECHGQPISKGNDHKRCARCWKSYQLARREPTEVIHEHLTELQAIQILTIPMSEEAPKNEGERATDLHRSSTPEARMIWVRAFIQAINTQYEVPKGVYRSTHDRDTGEQYIQNQAAYMLKFHQQPKQYSISSVNARLHLLYDAAYKYQAGNKETVYDDGGDCQGYGYNDVLSFSQRLQWICYILWEDKRVTMDVIEGRGVNAFVRNPWAYANRKIDNIKSNQKKKDNKKESGKTADTAGNSRKTQLAVAERLMRTNTRKVCPPGEVLVDKHGVVRPLILIGPPRAPGKEETITRRKRDDTESHDPHPRPPQRMPNVPPEWLMPWPDPPQKAENPQDTQPPSAKRVKRALTTWPAQNTTATQAKTIYSGVESPFDVSMRSEEHHMDIPMMTGALPHDMLGMTLAQEQLYQQALNYEYNPNDFTFDAAYQPPNTHSTQLDPMEQLRLMKEHPGCQADRDDHYQQYANQAPVASIQTQQQWVDSTGAPAQSSEARPSRRNPPRNVRPPVTEPFQGYLG